MYLPTLIEAISFLILNVLVIYVGLQGFLLKIDLDCIYYN